jgi:formate hydrogenlyase subunit 3/multisubunit Na+/H+ antiporter MnhD subunit
MTGIGRKMPFTLLCFLIGSLVMIGLPLTSGFVSKWFLISGIIQHEMTTLLVMVIILSTILNTAYFIPFVYRAFQKPQKNELSNIEKLPKSMVISIGFCALFSIYLFFDPGIIFNIIRLTGIVI